MVYCIYDGRWIGVGLWRVKLLSDVKHIKVKAGAAVGANYNQERYKSFAASDALATGEQVGRRDHRPSDREGDGRTCALEVRQGEHRFVYGVVTVPQHITREKSTTLIGPIAVYVCHLLSV